MPQRFLRPALRNSERWNAVSEQAQSFYIRLLNIVDDYGRFDGRPAVLLSECYTIWNALNPQCAHDVSTVTALCQQLVSKKLISFYDCERDGAKRTFLQFEQWVERSRVASKWPEPSPEMLSPCWHDAVTVTAPCQPSVPVPVPVPYTIVQTESASPPSEKVSGNGKPTPKARFEKPTVEAAKLNAAKIGLPESEAVKFWNYYESKGWTVGKSPMKSWQAAMITWRGNWQERNPGRSSANPNPITIPSQSQLTQKGGPL